MVSNNKLMRIATINMKKTIGQELVGIAITVAVATVFGFVQKKVRSKITDLTGR